MPRRRVSLPGASELFRGTQAADESADLSRPAVDAQRADYQRIDTQRVDTQRVEVEDSGEASADATATARGSGRVRHDEKITVYVSSDELVALEQARLTLRARHGMAIDRGRIVREAIAAIVADLNEYGEESELVRRLSQS